MHLVSEEWQPQNLGAYIESVQELVYGAFVATQKLRFRHDVDRLHYGSRISKHGRKMTLVGCLAWTLKSSGTVPMDSKVHKVLITQPLIHSFSV